MTRTSVAIMKAVMTAAGLVALLVSAHISAFGWTNPVRLTTNSTYDGYPDWSPDGKRIVFMSDRTGPFNLWLMDSDGSSQVMLTDNWALDARPHWFPTGGQVLFNRDKTIWKVDVSQGESSAVAIYASWSQSPKISHDETKIAFEGPFGGLQEIFTINSDGSGLFQVTSIPGRNQQTADWHPDGSKLAFVSWDGSGYDIRTIEPDGGNLKVLRSGVGEGLTPRWSPDGRRIAFFAGQDIWVMDADGSNLSKVTDGVGINYWPAWSPHGDRIAFMSSRSGSWDIWVTGLTAREYREDAIARLEAWLPSGDKKLDKYIKKLIGHFEKSLEWDFWTDENHLDLRHGKKVFEEDERIIQTQIDIGDFDNTEDWLKDDAISSERIVVIGQLDDARGAGGNLKEIRKAEEELAKAEGEYGDGNLDRAVDHFKKAWEHAVKAMEKVKEFGQEQMAVARPGIPLAFSLSQCYPNPVTGSATIEYAIPRDCHVRLDLFNSAGQRVMTLIDLDQTAGYRAVNLDGELLSGGIYFYRMVAGGNTDSRKMIVIK